MQHRKMMSTSTESTAAGSSWRRSRTASRSDPARHGWNHHAFARRETRLQESSAAQCGFRRLCLAAGARAWAAVPQRLALDVSDGHTSYLLSIGVQARGADSMTLHARRSCNRTPTRSSHAFDLNARRLQVVTAIDLAAMSDLKASTTNARLNLADRPVVSIRYRRDRLYRLQRLPSFLDLRSPARAREIKQVSAPGRRIEFPDLLCAVS